MDLAAEFKYRVQRMLPGGARRKLRRAKRRMMRVRITPVHSAPLAEDGRVLACLVAYNDHGGYCIPRSSSHRPAAQAIVKGKVWERQTLRLIGDRAGNGDIVHAGTYYGDFLPALAASRAEGAAIWAFEPNRENFRCAEITVKINDLQDVHLFNAGLGERASEAWLTTRETSGAPLGGGCRIRPAGSAGIEAISEVVRIASIDDTVPPERAVSVIHLDVEMYEAQALTGAMGTLGRCRPLLILETVPEQPWLDRHLAPLGYVRAGMVDDNTVFECRDRPEAGIPAAA